MKELLFSKTISCKYLDTADEEIEKAVMCDNFGFALSARILDDYEEAYNNKLSETVVRTIDSDIRISRYCFVDNDLTVHVFVNEFNNDKFYNVVSVFVFRDTNRR